LAAPRARPFAARLLFGPQTATFAVRSGGDPASTDSPESAAAPPVIPPVHQ